MRIEMDKIYCGDSLQVLQTLPENAVDCCVTSPPYYALRDYGADGQIGREATPEEYVSRITAVFHEVKRVLTPEGTCWLNIADTYCGTGSKADHQDPKYPKGRNGQQVAFNHRAPGCKPKDLIGIPWLVALALRGDGWYLRSSIIWYKTTAYLLKPSACALIRSRRLPTGISVVRRNTKSHRRKSFATTMRLAAKYGSAARKSTAISAMTREK